MKFSVTAQVAGRTVAYVTSTERDLQSVVASLTWMTLGAYRNERSELVDPPELSIVITRLED